MTFATTYAKNLQELAAHDYYTARISVYYLLEETNEYLIYDLRSIAIEQQEDAKRIWLKQANVRGLFD